MDVKEIEKSAKRDFNNAICLMGIIPALIFAYLISVKIASITVFKGEIGYIFFASVLILFIGIVMGKRLLWRVMKGLFNYNKENLKLQEELIEKSRLATITETTLTLSHELNNPLFIAIGNLELLENEFVQNKTPESIRKKFEMIKKNFERMREVTSKLSKLSKPVSGGAYSSKTIIDLKKSE